MTAPVVVVGAGVGGLAAALRLRVESLLRLDRLSDARALLAADQGVLEPAVRKYLAARVDQLEKKYLQAVAGYRDVYYNHPRSDQADEAEKRLGELNRVLGSRYPKASAELWLHRAELLFAAGDYPKASAEYGRAAAAGLKGPNRERALVRKGGADYRRGWTNTSYNSLLKLKISDSGLDAERLYYVCASFRRKRLISRFVSTAEELGSKYPNSHWYAEALFALGNHFLLENKPQEYRHWYQRLANTFPKGKHAGSAHWKLCWRAYLDQDPRRRQLFEQHLERYPEAPSATSAMYWLARIAESNPARVQVHMEADSAAVLGQVLDGEPQPARPGGAQHQPVGTSRKRLVVQVVAEDLVVALEVLHVDP